MLSFLVCVSVGRYNARTGAPLCRSSQPMVGLTAGACPEDEQLLLKLRAACARTTAASVQQRRLSCASFDEEGDAGTDAQLRVSESSPDTGSEASNIEDAQSPLSRTPSHHHAHKRERRATSARVTSSARHKGLRDFGSVCVCQVFGEWGETLVSDRGHDRECCGKATGRALERV